MTPALSIEIARESARVHGGKCLSTEYKNNHTNLLWECDMGHQWNADLNRIRRKKCWCPVCSKKAPLSIKIANEEALKKGGKCLSTKYKNVNTKLLWECKETHQWEATLANIRAKRWCPTCAYIKVHNLNCIHSIESAREFAENIGGKCLSTNYIPNTNLLWECAKNHRWEAQFAEIQRGRWCRKCFDAIPKATLLSIESAREFAETLGGKCLSTKYKNARSYLLWECEKRHQWKAPYAEIRRGSWCGNCSMYRTEKCIEQILAKMFPCDTFSKIRPDWNKNPATNKNLELDFYCENLCLAIEYMGQQHYEFIKFFHRNSLEEFKCLQLRDAQKVQNCLNNNVILIVIPYTVGDFNTPSQLEEFICVELSAHNLLPLTS